MQPSDFLKLAAVSVLRPGNLQNSRTYGRPELLALRDVPDQTGEAPDGKPSKSYYVIQARSSDTSFKAYVCDYAIAELRYQVLGTEAQICLTTTVNGCTFAVGIPAPDGTVIVSHTNMPPKKVDEEDILARSKDSQGGLQNRLAKAFHGHGRLLGPESYWPGSNEFDKLTINVTVFGIFDSGWKFYYQRWTSSRQTGIDKLIDLTPFKKTRVKF